MRPLRARGSIAASVAAAIVHQPVKSIDPNPAFASIEPALRLQQKVS